MQVTDLKILRGQVYATLSVKEGATSRTELKVRLTPGHKGVQEALATLTSLVKAAAEAQLGDAVTNTAVSDAKATARKELASQVLGMVQRGTMPTDLERALRPMVRP